MSQYFETTLIVTGYTGFLGRYLVPEMISAYSRLVLVGRKWQEEGAPSIKGIPVRYVDFEGLPALFSDDAKGSVHVLNLAAQIDNSNIEKDGYLVNEQLLVAVLSYIPRGSVVVHASTQMAYGNIKSLAVSENTVFDIDEESYGVSKINCENWLKHFCRSRELKAVMLRFPGFIESKTSVFNYLCETLSAGGKVELYGRGESVRDYIGLEDALSAVCLSFSYANQSLVLSQFEDFNIGSEQTLSVKELTQRIASLIGSDSEIILVDKPVVKNDFLFDITKAKHVLKYSPQDTLNVIERMLSND